MDLMKLMENLPPPSGKTNQLWYATGVQGAVDQYRRTGDWNAYLSDCAYLSIKFALDQTALKNPALRYAAGALSALQHVVRAAVEAEIELLREPDYARETPHDYVMHVADLAGHHVERHIERFEESLQRALHHIGVC